MAHLHIPDGVLPTWLWLAGWGLAALLLAATWRGQQRRAPQRIAYEGALGALMLAAMAVEVPLGPVEYHLTLAGPIGVLLGAAGALQAAFIASAILALVGHGGLTLIGLNTLLLGAAAALASWTYGLLAARRPGAMALAGATAAGHLASAGLWFALVMAGAHARAVQAGVAPGAGRLALLAAVALPLALFAVAAESTAAFGMGTFLMRVRPDLLPRTAAHETPAS